MKPDFLFGFPRAVAKATMVILCVYKTWFLPLYIVLLPELETARILWLDHRPQSNTHTPLPHTGCHAWSLMPGDALVLYHLKTRKSIGRVSKYSIKVDNIGWNSEECFQNAQIFRLLLKISVETSQTITLSIICYFSKENQKQLSFIFARVWGTVYSGCWK